MSLRLDFFGLSFVVLRVHELGDDFSGMAARIEVVGMRDGFAFAPLFAPVLRENVLSVVVVEVLVLVNVGHYDVEFARVHS